ncbi:MAG: cytochrome c maturation protein CcmE [Deltaproteobacteria bacterium]|nr:cytochrome c maturation protein CcmE [Nannocystaceae bacterium]
MALTLGTKLGIGVVLAGAIGYLVVSDTGEGVLEYLYVDKLMSDVQKYEHRTLKVHGIVVKGSIQRKKGETGDMKFVVEYGGQRLPVHYTNDPPDTFQEEGEVVLTGQLVEGTFESDEMSAKCPSKYEEEQGSLPPGAGKPAGAPMAPRTKEG